MPTNILGTPTDIADLSTYNATVAGGINHNNNVSLSSLLGNPILLSFINHETAYPWLANLINIKNSLSVKLYIVMFWYNSAASSFDAPWNDEVIVAIVNAGLSEDDFLDIPVLIDKAGAGSWASVYLNGILGEAGFHGSINNYDMWSYLISSDYLITDKWHTDCTKIDPEIPGKAEKDPISFKQLGQYKAVLEVTGYAVGDTLSISLHNDMPSPNPDLTGINSINIDAAGNVTTSINDPRIQSIIPAEGNITSLSSIIITFYENMPNAGTSGYYDMTLSGVTVSCAYQNRADFSSTDYNNTEMYVHERLSNLQYKPAILRYTPEKNANISTFPTINAPINIVFSKPIMSPAEGDFAINGAGGLTALTDSVDTDGNGITDGTFSYNTIENNVLLTLYGEVTTGASDDPVDITLSNIEDTASVPMVGQNVITYITNDNATSVSHDIVIVLDYSGSMGSYVSIDDGSGSGSVQERKVKILEDAVKEFVNIKGEFPVAGDNVSLIKFFNSQVETTVDGINNNPGDPLHYINNYLNEIAGGLTPLGGALYNALIRQDGYQGSNPLSNKVIIVFTDGIQNMNPSIYPDVGLNAFVGYYSGSHSWGYGGSQSNVYFYGARQILNNYPIFTIGVGTENDTMFYDMLNGISNESDGIHQSIEPDSLWPDTSGTFSTFLASIYYGSSPQIICKVKGIYQSGISTIIEFILNRSVKKLVLSLSWLKTNPLCLKIKKDGSDVAIANYTIIKADAFGMVSIDFTKAEVLAVFPNEEDKEGTWQAEIVPAPGVSGKVMYHLVVFGDEKVIQVDIDEPSVQTGDLIQPEIDQQFTDLYPDNSMIEITFTEEVYSNNNATGALTAADFSINFSKNGGTANSVAVSGVSHTAGTMSAILYLNVAGTPDGNESMIISPKVNSIFDAAGNAALPIANTGDVLLFDQLPPSIVASSLSADNSSISIEFSEGVLNTPNGIGSLETNDFTIIFDQNGGSATGVVLSNVMHTAGSPFVTINLNVTGYPDGNEKIIITPNLNSIYDASGNVSSSSVTTGALNLHDMKNPVIAQAVLASDNQELRLNFSENVYSKNDMTGQLDKTDFTLVFSKNGGNATAAVIDEVTHAAGSKMVMIRLNITNIPDGKETITISPKADSVYDAAGNKAQANDSVIINLKDKYPPLVKKWDLESNNMYVEVFFTEDVYGTPFGIDALKPSDFLIKFDKNGGTATDTQISSVQHSAGSDSAKLLLNISGIPSGKEKITISPEKNSIFDIAGNAVVKNNANAKSFSLNDMTLPVIMGVTLSKYNAVLTVIFNEGVYSSKGAKGALNKDAFNIKFDKNGGTADKVTITVMAHEPGSNLVEFFLKVHGNPSGDEFLAVSICPDSIFDKSDNVVKELIYKDRIYLNDIHTMNSQKPDQVYTGDPLPLGVSVKENKKPGSSIYAAVADIVHPEKPFWYIVQKNLKWIESNIKKKKLKREVTKPDFDKPEDIEPLPNVLYDVMMTNKVIAKELLKKKNITLDLRPESQKLRQQSIWTGHKLTKLIQAKKRLKTTNNILSIKDIQNRVKFSFQKTRTIFTGVIKQVKVPGKYVISYKVKGASKDSGIYERTLTKFVNVIICPDPKYTKIYGEYDDKNKDFIITLIPFDRFKNQFVPGSVHKLTCILDEHERISLKNIKGEINGSYLIAIPVQSKDDLRKRKLMVRSEGVILFNDFLNNIKPFDKKSSSKSKESGKLKKTSSRKK